ncbi:Hypothetical protein NAEGRDRAFT_69101 [Naegleria gruberi]|uniref:F-box domain-containing protein n=1 Tax=Naegleria gruberi TaxID=5762 RepID=D2VJN3_NAEGR|nr:uncharacterized protein NAEGRDRAFT_69101 [Naegleria gruberi]EFC43060.1 Hypothetical protein NAEGRDRAFT_69101 [Naegleria gruberi]|eukprot:XP_002675804.1 Hypothetical protein NAEGRDRAFT_69101 [Naegleria gruberi strain NEG-M]
MKQPLLELPDEMLLTILNFTSRNPRDLIILSHTCRRFEKLVENSLSNTSNSSTNDDQSINLFEMIKIETSEYLRRGFLFEKLIKRPFGTIYDLVRDYWTASSSTATIIERQIKSEEEKREECRMALNSKEKLVNAFYFARMDVKFSAFDRKVQELIARVAKRDPTVLFGVILTLMSIAAQVCVGQYSSNQVGEKDWNGVFWWIPYCFAVVQTLLGGVWCGFTAFSLLRGIGILRKLNIHRFTTKFHKDVNLFVANLAIPVFAGLILLFNGYGMYSVKSLLYSILGIEMSYSHILVNTINYYLSFPIWIYLGVVSISELKKIFKMIVPPTVTIQSLLSNYIISLFLGVSCYKLGGGCLSALPIAVTLLADSWEVNALYIKEKLKVGFFGLSRFALGVSLAILGCGHCSYFTFAPVTLATVFETIGFLFGKKHETCISPIDETYQ